MRTGLVCLGMLALLLVGGASAAERKPAPAVTGVTLDGKRLSLATLRGKPVVVNVWSSW